MEKKNTEHSSLRPRSFFKINEKGDLEIEPGTLPIKSLYGRIHSVTTIILLILVCLLYINMVRDRSQKQLYGVLASDIKKISEENKSLYKDLESLRSYIDGLNKNPLSKEKSAPPSIKPISSSELSSKKSFEAVLSE